MVEQPVTKKKKPNKINSDLITCVISLAHARRANTKTHSWKNTPKSAKKPKKLSQSLHPITRKKALGHTSSLRLDDPLNTVEYFKWLLNWWLLSSLGCHKIRVVCRLGQEVHLRGRSAGPVLCRGLHRIRWMVRRERSLAVRHRVGRVGWTSWTWKREQKTWHGVRFYFFFFSFFF